MSKTICVRFCCCTRFPISVSNFKCTYTDLIDCRFCSKFWFLAFLRTINPLKLIGVNEFNQDLYRNFDMTLTYANYIYGLYDGHINKVMDRVFERYGPAGLRKEIK